MTDLNRLLLRGACSCSLSRFARLADRSPLFFVSATFRVSMSMRVFWRASEPLVCSMHFRPFSLLLLYPHTRYRHISREVHLRFRHLLRDFQRGMLHSGCFLYSPPLSCTPLAHSLPVISHTYCDQFRALRRRVAAVFYFYPVLLCVFFPESFFCPSSFLL